MNRSTVCRVTATLDEEVKEFRKAPIAGPIRVPLLGHDLPGRLLGGAEGR